MPALAATPHCLGLRWLPRPRSMRQTRGPAPGWALRLSICALLPGLALTVHAQTSPAFGPLGGAPAASASTPAGTADDIPMADYLALLRQIAPAAETGARSYLAAFQLRCGRAMATTELRRALSEGSGDPVLVGFIRAAQLQDTANRPQLVARLRCPAGSAP